MNAARQERFLMRQRGAGARELRDDDFGLALPGVAGSSAQTPGTAAQRARRTPRSRGSATRSKRGGRRSSTRLSKTSEDVQTGNGEVTMVDENGSVTKKRRVAPEARQDENAPTVNGAQSVPEAFPSDTQPSLTGEKRKEKRSVGRPRKQKDASNSSPTVATEPVEQGKSSDQVESGVNDRTEELPALTDVPEEPEGLKEPEEPEEPEEPVVAAVAQVMKEPAEPEMPKQPEEQGQSETVPTASQDAEMAESQTTSRPARGRRKRQDPKNSAAEPAQLSNEQIPKANHSAPDSLQEPVQDSILVRSEPLEPNETQEVSTVHEPEEAPGEEKAASELDPSPFETDIVEVEESMDQGAEGIGTEADETEGSPREKSPELNRKLSPMSKKRKKRKSVNLPQRKRSSNSALQPVPEEVSNRSAEASHEAMEAPTQTSRPPRGRLLIGQQKDASDQAHAAQSENQQGIVRRGRGRPRKSTQVAPVPGFRQHFRPMNNMSASNNQQQQRVAKSGKRPRNEDDAIPVTIHQLGNRDLLEQLSLADNTATTTVPRKTEPNAVDVLNQVCGEIIANKMEAISDAAGRATERSDRALFKRRVTALNTFKRALEVRLFDMTQAVDYHDLLKSRVRHVFKAHKSLKARFVDTQKANKEASTKHSDLKKQYESAKALHEGGDRIVGLIKDIRKAVRNGRALPADKQSDAHTSFTTAKASSSKGGNEADEQKVRNMAALLEKAVQER